MRAKLSDEEFQMIEKFRERLMALGQQVENLKAHLKAQGNELADVINTVWNAAHRRLQIEDVEFAERLAGNSVPPFVNDMGQQVVRLDRTTKEAIWDTPHDVKRTAELETQKATMSEEDAK